MTYKTINHIENARLNVLNRALDLIGKHGLTDEMLKATCQDLGENELFFYTLFPLGIEDFVLYMIEDLNQKMTKEFQYHATEIHKVSDKISKLIQIRLNLMAMHKEVYLKLHYYLSTPCNLLLASKTAYKIADLMWKLAGDQSVDFNYYTKRMILTGVYSSTSLYWIHDDSENNHETWEFLNRRLDDVKKINQIKQKFTT